MNHNGLIVCDGYGSGVAYSTGQRVRRLLSMVRFSECRERRTDQQQNNCGNCQSHKQFDQAETLLLHGISFPGELSPTQSMRGCRQMF
ncbi:hypothetical protein D3C80_2027210 [compost metagenome]